MREIREGTPSQEFLRLGGRSMRDLEAFLLRGETPDLDRIAGWEYRGLNPPYLAPLGIRKFIKGFYKDEGDAVWGYNIPAAQNSLGAPWAPKNPGHPKRFGFFRVRPVDPAARDNAYLHAMILDYSEGDNPRLDPTQTLRDYIVRVDAGSDDLLLGKAYVAVGPIRVPTSFFILERHRPTDYRR
jgi:hypothetical protein